MSHSRGGSRAGAGRRPNSGLYGEATVAMRVPVSLQPSVVSLLEARRLQKLREDGSQPLPFPTLGAIIHARPLHPKPPKRLIARVGVHAQAGLAVPMDDFQQDGVDLNELLVRDPDWTYLVEASGDSMDLAGIPHGATMVVSRKLEPVHGNIVVAIILGEGVTVKRLYKTEQEIALEPESSNPSHQRRVLTEFDEWVVWGVVTDAIRRFR